MTLNPEQINVMNALIDRYERSKSFVEQTASARRIQLNFYYNGFNDFPDYNIEDNDSRLTYTEAVKRLKEKRFADFSWMRGEEEHLIGKVWLNVDSLKEIYHELRRVPKADYVASVIVLIQAALEKVQETDWARNCLSDWITVIKKKRTIGSFLPPGLREIREFLQAIVFAAESRDYECLERVFSIRCFGNSKTFEHYYRKRLIRILKKYSDDRLSSEDLTEKEILEQIGIVKYPEQVAFCGGVSLHIHDQMVDYSGLTSGAYFNAADMRLGELILNAEVKKIVLIENKANYFDYIMNHRQADELVVFHGGCYSPAKGLFFQKLCEAANSKIRIYHWSDIDLGGFRMLARLRKNFFPDLYPYRMNEQELMNYSAYALPIKKKAYLDMLKKLLVIPELSDCYSCLSFMLEHKVKLEQEAMIE